MKYDFDQLSIFEDDNTVIKVPKSVYHIYAVDKFDNTMIDDIEAVSWKQAVFLFKKKHGFYWNCHR